MVRPLDPEMLRELFDDDCVLAPPPAPAATPIQPAWRRLLARIDAFLFDDPSWCVAGPALLLGLFILLFDLWWLL